MDFAEAAGGVVWRRGADGTVQVLLAHRPFDENWTLPRRRVAAVERDADAALRGVEEDTVDPGGARRLAYPGEVGVVQALREQLLPTSLAAGP